MNRMWIWASRKLFPELSPKLEVDEDGSTNDYPLFGQTCSMQLYDEASENIWKILHLVWGRLISHTVAVRMSNLKDPRQSVPVDAWEDFIEDDVGLFPVRLRELLNAFNSNQFLSYKELLKAWCGGSLVQPCSFCDTTMTVEAVSRKVEGCERGVAVVSLLPHMTPMYCCGASTCEEEMDSKENAWWKWSNAVILASNKLFGNRCNFCFKLSEEVHR